MLEQEELIECMFKRGVLLNEELLEKGIDSYLLDKLDVEGDLVVLTSDYSDVIRLGSSLVDWYEIDKLRVEVEKERDEELYQNHLQEIKLTIGGGEQQQDKMEQNPSGDKTGGALRENDSSVSGEPILSTTKQSLPQISSSGGSSAISVSSTPIISNIVLLESHVNVPHKYEIRDFTNFFLSRYRFLDGLLRNRRELENVLTINRVQGMKEKGAVSIIGLVEEINETKNGNLIITIEDPTGRIKVLISKNKADLFAAAKDLVVDEVIGLSGMCGDNIIFVDGIIWPEVPGNHELKKGESDEYALFLSDIHFGSTLFLKSEFAKFLKWLNGEAGNEEQSEIARKVKYIFVAGDLVDGVGIYPSQEEELEIKDIKEQYSGVCGLLREIPASKQIIICPGNHDVVPLAEPQSSFCSEFASGLLDFPNVTLVSNPAMINVGKTETFSGFNVLLYHGYSFDYYVANVESIRNGGGYHRSDLIMKFLLKRRHLAPSFKSTPYFPSHKEDPLLIKTLPDFFVTGHIHYSCVANYRGITTICGSCWQSKTSFQEKLGHEPEPARVPVINLKTREVKVLRFG